MKNMRNENSKIQIPNVDKGYLQRAADVLLSSLQEDIILINAGAGYGKTQMLASYIHQFSIKCAWYSISGTDDNDLMSFIKNFTKSVQNALGNNGSDFHACISSAENIDILIEHLVIWLDEHIDFLNIVFDDFQEITNPDIFNLLDILIETMDKKIRLFIVEKRSLPVFFDKYTKSGRAVCIGTDELKFTPSEIAVFLKDMGDEAGLCAKFVYDCTEGWPVGIAQIMLQLRQLKLNATPDILKEICENLEVSDYFMTRVYKMLPFDIQTFLKKTAVLDFMTPSICNKITGIHNADSMLLYLVNEKLFVQTLGEIKNLYRYHSVFQRFLLLQTSCEEKQEIFRTAAHFLLQTNDKIQAGEYACRAKAADIVEAVIEVCGDSMLEDRLYGTLERWYAFLTAQSITLSPKTRFIYGKYLMAAGQQEEAERQIEQAETIFYKEGRMRDYKRVLLFKAASKRRTGEAAAAEQYILQAAKDPEPVWNETAEAVCTEQAKINCCLHKLKDTESLLYSQTEKGIVFREDSFLSAAQLVLTHLNRRTEISIATHEIQPEHIPEGFLLRSLVLAEQMNSACRSADHKTARETAKKIIALCAHETLQTAAAWEVLAVLSWEDGDYRKAVEQSRTGNIFLWKNQIWNLNFSPKYQQILNEIQSIQKNTAGTHRLITQTKESAPKEPVSSQKLKIQCMGCFLVVLPKSDGTPMKWRTKKAQELFAYLFHLQGASVSREVLIELLWPDAGMKSAIALFHTTLYSIRQAFVQEGLEELILYEKKKYSLNMQLADSDLKDLKAYLNNTDAWHQNPELIMQLYPGSYMGSSGYLWSYGMAKELENQYLKALTFGAALRAGQNRPEEALPFFRRMLEADPYNEEIVSKLIACLYKSGRQSEAKRQYDRMQKLYLEDLELNFTKSFKEIIAKA